MPARDDHGVGPELLRHPAAHDLALQAVSDAPAHRGRVDHGRHVTEKDGRRAAQRDHRVPQVVERRDPAHRSDRPLHRALDDDARGGVLVRAFEGVDDLVEGHATPGGPLGVEQDLVLAEVAAEPLDRRDPGYGEEPVLDLELGQVAERHQVYRPRLGLQRELEDFVQAAGEAGQQRGVGPGRHLRRGLRDALGHELARAVVVGLGVELDRDLRHAELRGGPDAPHVRQPAERDLHRDGDAGLQLLRVHGGVLDDDVEDGHGEIRETRRGAGRAATRGPGPRANRTSPPASTGRAKKTRMTRRTRPPLSVVMVLAFPARLVRLGLQQERAFDHDRVAGAQPGKDLDLAAEVAPAADFADLELAFLVPGHEDAPAVAQSLEGGGGNGDDGLRTGIDGEEDLGRHPGPQHARRVGDLDADRERARAGIDLPADQDDGSREASGRAGLGT